MSYHLGNIQTLDNKLLAYIRQGSSEVKRSVNSIFGSVRCAGILLVKARHRVRDKDRQNTGQIPVKYRIITGKILAIYRASAPGKLRVL